MRKPIFIAFLNYWVWGLGGLMLGRRRLSNGLIALGCLLLTYLVFSFSPSGPFAQLAPSFFWPLQFTGMLAVSIGFAVSGFVEARDMEKATANGHT